MRERLVAAFVGLTVLVVALFGIPRAYVVADLVRSGEQARVDRTAEVVALLLDERIADGRPVSTAYLDSLADAGELVEVSGSPGTVSSSTGPHDLAGAVRATRRLTSGGQVTVARTGTAVGDEVAAALLPLVVLGLVLAALAALVGFVLAGRLARPFRHLAEAARGLGAGQLLPDVPDHGVPEARAIGTALAESGRRLDTLLAHERQVATQASHELRTPVTALRLELEDLALWPDTSPAVAAELRRCVGELDRLSTAITDLLELSGTQRAEAERDLDLDVLVADTTARLRDTGVRVVHEPRGSAPTRLDPEPVVQALELLVREAGRDDSGRVLLTVVPHSAHFEVRLSATPVREGALRPVRSPRAGADWARAGELAAAAGGQVARDGEVVVLRLPRRELRGPGMSHGAGGARS